MPLAWVLYLRKGSQEVRPGRYWRTSAPSTETKCWRRMYSSPPSLAPWLEVIRTSCALGVSAGRVKVRVLRVVPTWSLAPSA